MRRKILIVLTIFGIGGFIYSMVPIRSKENMQSTGKERWVILVHGVLRSSSSMSKIQAALREKGYHTHSFEYNSRKETIKSIDHRLHKDISNILKRNVETISFVTHSFGTLVVRYYLANHELKRGGRFVMIAPPNKGSQWARILGRFSLYNWALGVAGEKVQDVEQSIPKIMAPPPIEFGVISGGSGTKFGINPLLPGDDDGTVTVEETKLEGMKDFIQVRGQHSLLLVQKSVIDNILSFLEKGTFLR